MSDFFFFEDAVKEDKERENDKEGKMEGLGPSD